jgi:hypothetical protein
VLTSFSIVDGAGNPVVGGPFTIFGNQLIVADASQLAVDAPLFVTVRVTDKGLLTFDKTFPIHVTNFKAVADHFTTDEDSSLLIPVASMAANDIDPGHKATVSAVGNASHGTVTLTNGVATFTPDHDFSGVAHFDYTISDGQGGSSTVTETVDVAPVADAPTLSVQAIMGSGDGPELPVDGLISPLANGGFAALAFEGGQFIGKIFDANHNLVGSEAVQLSAGGLNAASRFFSPLLNGRFALTWVVNNSVGLGNGSASIFTQIFDAVGNTISPVITVSSITPSDTQAFPWEGARI